MPALIWVGTDPCVRPLNSYFSTVNPGPPCPGIWVRMNRGSLSRGFCIILLAILGCGRTRPWEDMNEIQLTRLVMSEPNNDTARLYLGILLYEQSRPEEAEPRFRQALALNPDYPEAHYNLGRVLMDKGLYPEAERELREAIRLRPDYPDPHAALGTLLLVAGRDSSAVAEWTEALRLDPDNDQAHYNLGVWLYKQGRKEEAKKEFRETVRANPDHAKAHGNLGIIYRDEGDYEKAREEFEAAVGLFEKQGKIWDAMKAREMLENLPDQNH